MKRYKVYGDERTNLALTNKAEEGYSGCDYKIHECVDGSYEIWLDNHAEVVGMTAEEVNDYFETIEDAACEIEAES